MPPPCAHTLQAEQLTETESQKWEKVGMPGERKSARKKKRDLESEAKPKPVPKYRLRFKNESDKGAARGNLAEQVVRESAENPSQTNKKHRVRTLLRNRNVPLDQVFFRPPDGDSRLFLFPFQGAGKVPALASP